MRFRVFPTVSETVGSTVSRSVSPDPFRGSGNTRNGNGKHSDWTILKDTRPRVATCNRCGSVVLAAMASGMRAAVEPTPLNFEAMFTGMCEGDGPYYKIDMVNGKPARLTYLTPHLMRYPAAKAWTYARSHGCGCHAMDATAFEEAQDPTQALVSALGGSQGLSRAQDATQPRSEPRRAVRCSECKQLIPADEDRFMIEWPVWTSVTHRYNSRGPKKGYERTFEGWGTDRWAVHPDGCPGKTKTT